MTNVDLPFLQRLRPVIIAWGMAVLCAGCTTQSGHAVAPAPQVTSVLGAMSVDPSCVVVIEIGTNAKDSKLGAALAAGRDVDGDGVADIVAGAPGAESLHGGIALLLGWGPDGAPSSTWLGGDELDLGYPSGYGHGVALGDFDGDGYADAAVGAPFHSGGAKKGSLVVHAGGPTGLSATPSMVISGGAIGIGGSMAGADVNGDGFDDLVVSGSGDDPIAHASLYLGAAGGLSAKPSWTYLGGAVNSILDIAVAGVGDVNHDGYDDVAVVMAHGRAKLFLGTSDGLEAEPAWEDSSAAPFELSVAAAGDVDGDGVADVLVGNRRFEGPPGEGSRTTNAVGRVALYRGTPAGLEQEPFWTYVGTVEDEELGTSVGAAGDFNGDGYGDFLVGAPRYDVDDPGQPQEGRVLLFLGGPDGPGTAPAVVVEGNAWVAKLGETVAAADVDGDGRSDIIAGAPGAFFGRGALYVATAAAIDSCNTSVGDGNVETGDGEGADASGDSGVMPGEDAIDASIDGDATNTLDGDGGAMGPLDAVVAEDSGRVRDHTPAGDDEPQSSGAASGGCGGCSASGATEPGWLWLAALLLLLRMRRRPARSV
ncbi:MAG: hypothetical protein AMXMBFR64_02290 [Myxococcales bacterium]